MEKSDFLRISVSPTRDTLFGGSEGPKNPLKSLKFQDKLIPHGKFIEKRDFLKTMVKTMVF